MRAHRVFGWIHQRVGAPFVRARAGQMAMGLALGALLGCGGFLGIGGDSPLSVGWGPPFTGDSTLGKAIEHRFGVMLKSCRVAKIDEKERSAIPAVLQQALDRDLSRRVVTINGQSSWNLFRFVS